MEEWSGDGKDKRGRLGEVERGRLNVQNSESPPLPLS
jgi:hypothetical protein